MIITLQLLEQVISALQLFLKITGALVITVSNSITLKFSKLLNFKVINLLQVMQKIVNIGMVLFGELRKIPTLIKSEQFIAFSMINQSLSKNQH